MIRILIVDDHEHIRGMIRALLEAEKGWQVCGEAADGRAGIDQCVLLEPNLVILDIHVPVRNGLEAARERAKTLETKAKLEQMIAEAVKNLGFVQYYCF